MKETIVYVVKMNRHNDPELHSYIQGVFTDEIKAREAGIAEEYYRGGKYKAHIYSFHLNQPDKEAMEYWLTHCGGDRKGIEEIEILHVVPE